MNSTINFICNNELVNIVANPAMVLLDFLRKYKKLTGTKEGCREGDCGACAVLLGELEDNKVQYNVVNSCLLPLIAVNGKHVVTIEGLNSEKLNSIQQAIVDEGATQCGFCTPGFIISLTGYFLSNDEIYFEEAINYLDGNICRCTGYISIKRSVKSVIDKMISQKPFNHLTIERLIKSEIIPSYFQDIYLRLQKLQSNTLMEKVKEFPDFLIGGGTDLFVQKQDELLSSSINLVRDGKSFSEIKLENDKIYIGSCVTVNDIQNSNVIQKYFPELTSQLNLFGSTPIRNQATIGGNIINASPIGDMINILIALDAVLNLFEGNTERSVPLKNFYLGYKILDKKNNEILKSLWIPVPEGNYKFNFEKISRRTYLDIASVNSSIYLETQNDIIKAVNIAAGGVAPYPLYLEKTCKYLVDKEINYGNIIKAAAIAQSEITPITDVRGSAEYKSLLLHQLILAHFIKLFPSLIDVEELV
jgi:xanthine dehydrogenase small subunit